MPVKAPRQAPFTDREVTRRKLPVVGLSGTFTVPTLVQDRGAGAASASAYSTLGLSYVCVRSERIELLCDPAEQIIGVLRPREDSPDGVEVGRPPSKPAEAGKWSKNRKLPVLFFPGAGISGGTFLQYYGIPVDEVGGKIYAAEMKEGVLQVDLKHPLG